MTTPRGLSRPSTSFIGLSCPRHPPCALHRQHKILRHPHTNNPHHNSADHQRMNTMISNKNHKKEDTRVHYTVLKQHNTQNNTITTIGNHITSRRSHKEQNRLSQTPNSHDKPKTSLTQPHKQCQPQHTHTLKQTMRHDPTTNNHTHVAEPVTYSPRNKNKHKYSLERR